MCDGPRHGDRRRLSHHRRPQHHGLHRQHPLHPAPTATPRSWPGSSSRIVFPSHYHIKMSHRRLPQRLRQGPLQRLRHRRHGSKMVYHYERCIGCGICVDACKKHATRRALLHRGQRQDRQGHLLLRGLRRVRRPSAPPARGPADATKFYRVLVGGRTGKQSPRMGKTFLNWVTEDVLLARASSNWQKFSAWVLDHKPVYMHGGHLIDMAGYDKFKEMMLEGVDAEPRGDGGAAHPVDRDRVPRPDQRDPAFRAPQGGPAKIGRLPEKASRAYAREAFLAPVSLPKRWRRPRREGRGRPRRRRGGGGHSEGCRKNRGCRSCGRAARPVRRCAARRA